ncbi:hypothetical protein ACFQMM_21595 [Saliphagus sp. GCM10025308]
MADTGARRHCIGDDRAVSTVLDVALCLVLMSAAVGILGIYLAGDEDTSHTPKRRPTRSNCSARRRSASNTRSDRPSSAPPRTLTTTRTTTPGANSRA